MSERSQAYTFRGKGFKVSLVMEMLYISNNCVMKWSVLCETGELSEVLFIGSHFNNSKRAGDMKHIMIAL